MIIHGIGTDITDVRPFAHMSENFKTTVFSEKEIEYCDSKKNPEQHYAARWCAKESFLKAVGRGIVKYMRRIEIGHQHNGVPVIILHGKLKEEFNEGYRTYVSLSHCGHYATANVTVVRLPYDK